VHGEENFAQKGAAMTNHAGCSGDAACAASGERRTLAWKTSDVGSIGMLTLPRWL